MAQVQPAVNTFIRDVEKLERKFQGSLKTVVRSLGAMTDTELIVAMGQLNLFNEIVQQGYGDALNRLERDYENLLAQAVAEANRRGVTALSGAGLQGLETLKDLKEIQEIFYNNHGVQMSLQKVVDHLIHFYLKER